MTIHQKIKDEKNYIFFSEQIYPYKQNLSTTAIANDVEFIPLNDIIKLKKGEFVYSMFDYHNLESFSKIPMRSVQETKTQDVKYTYMQMDFDSAIKFIITKRILYLQALRGLVESFNLKKSQELLKFWQLYKNAKLTL